jgi:outer membrane protein assembly factor BamB
MPRLALACFGLFTASTLAAAADWPQWLGPDRDALWTETGIATDLKKNPPKELWRVAVGGGYSGPAVVGDRVYVTDKLLKPGVVDPKDPFAKVKLQSVERLLCLDAKSGKEVWKHEYDCEYHIQYPCGPRCTPLVHDGKVYTLGAMGDLNCLSDKGKVLWSKNFPKDFDVKVPVWGFAGHPVIHKNLLICLVGGEAGAVVALEKDTGKTVWRALPSAEPGYNSPMLIKNGDAIQLVVWTPKHLTALNPETGDKYWQVGLEPQYGMSIMTPRKEGNLIFAAGIGNVGVTLKLDPKDPKSAIEVWRATGSPNPKDGVFPVNMTPFLDKGIVYGADQPGIFRAVELSTGARKWESFEPIFGDKTPADKVPSATAFMVKNTDNGLFYLFTETGDLTVAKFTDKGYEELGRLHLLEPTCTALNGRKAVWSHPAFANKSIYARNDKQLVCVPLAK